jgi:hypothetical protein
MASTYGTGGFYRVCERRILLLEGDFRALLLFMANFFPLPAMAFLEPLFTFILILRLEECRYM